MATTGVDPVIPLAIVTLVGLAFTYLGYDLFDLFLTWVGGAIGFGIGGGIGWFVLGGAESGMESQLAVAGVLALIGGFLGAALVSALARFAVIIASFIASTLAGLLVFVGETLFRPEAIPEEGEPVDPETVQEVVRIEQLLEGESQQALLLTLVVGLAGAALAYKFYPVVIAAATSIFGAVLLGGVMPLWQEGVLGGAELVFELNQTLNGWAGIALLTGFAFQSYRNSEPIQEFVDTTINAVT